MFCFLVRWLLYGMYSAACTVTEDFTQTAEIDAINLEPVE